MCEGLTSGAHGLSPEASEPGSGYSKAAHAEGVGSPFGPIGALSDMLPHLGVIFMILSTDPNANLFQKHLHRYSPKHHPRSGHASRIDK